MKHFKFKTTVKISGFRTLPVQGVASIKNQRIATARVVELINERVSILVKNGMKQNGEIPESTINSIQFKTTVEVLKVDFIINLDIPMVETEVSPEGVTAPSVLVNQSVNK